MRGLETVRLGEAWVYNGFWDGEHKELGRGQVSQESRESGICFHRLMP